VIACALPVTGCSLLNGPAIVVSGSPSATGPTASESPSASPSPSVSASPSPASTTAATPTPTGPITGAPAGTPVKPEVFLATVDTGNGVLKVVANVPGIYEDGGDCTVKVTGGSVVLQKQNTGEADATSTACGLFTFWLSDLPSGTATIVASYQSASYAGSSDPTKVTIP
jgi:hypothetical protein